MRIAESELIINGDGSVFHLHLRPEELADNVILVGDPGRVDMIAEYFDEKEFRHASRCRYYQYRFLSKALSFLLLYTFR